MSLDHSPRVHRFDVSTEPKRFVLGDDDFVFEATPDLPDTVLDLVPLMANLNAAAGREGIQPLYDFMEEVLTEESAAEFRRRVSAKRKTFGIGTIRQVITWLLEEYGLRPTQPSSLSSMQSSGADGMNSTAGA